MAQRRRFAELLDQLVESLQTGIHTCNQLAQSLQTDVRICDQLKTCYQEDMGDKKDTEGKK